MEVFKLHKSGYEVGTLGSIKGKRVEFLTPSVGDNGYLVVSLNRKTQYLHRLVVETFLGEIPEEKEVNHKNGIRTDARLENLEIVTRSENIKHSFDVLKRPSALGVRNGQAKLSEDDATEVIQMLEAGFTNEEVALKFGIANKYVSLIRHGKRWKHLPRQNLGKSLGKYPFSQEICLDLIADLVSGLDNQSLAKKYKVDRTTISKIRHRKSWIEIWRLYDTNSATTTERAVS